MDSFTAAERDEHLIATYESLKLLLNQWGQDVYDILVTLFDEMKADKRLQILSSCRLKTNESLVGKAFHRGLQYSEESRKTDELSRKISLILEETTDKIGLRIVLLTQADADEAFIRIKDYDGWHTHVARDIRTEILKQPETFLYTSHHVVVKPKLASKYDADQLAFLTCEIQIRSLLQHTFAEVSHDNFYKGPYQHDRELMRRLARSQALMETTDDLFYNVSIMMRDPNRRYAQYIDALTGLYQTYNPAFTARQVDYGVTDQYFKLLNEKDVEPTDIKDFLRTKTRDIRLAIGQNKNVYLFRQPIVLLLAYYAFNYPDFLEEKSELSNEDLLALKSGLNISTQYD